MSATKQDVDDLHSMVVIMGGVVAGLVVISIILGTAIIICVSRAFKKLEAISLTIKTTRLDVRKTLESVENSIVQNPVVVVEDKNDGCVIISDSTEAASPIFTRRMFTPTPLTSMTRIPQSDFEFERRVNSNNNIAADYSQPRKLNKGPPVPPRRAHSFYGEGDAYY